MTSRPAPGFPIVARYADLRSALAGREVLAFDAGPDAAPIVVSAPQEPPPAQERRGRDWFERRRPVDVQVHHVVARDAVVTSEIKNHPWMVHRVQPLPGGRWLLASVRCRRRGPDRNAFIYDDGALAARLTLGDGIQAIQADDAGGIWVSYFDEGVFGNLGWDEPLGAAGLVRWTERGEVAYAFAPPPGLPPIADCYALNVESARTTWLCYYTDFPLVRLEADRVTGTWQMPVHGASAFAVFADHVLTVGRYRAPTELQLLRLGRGVTPTPLWTADAGLPTAAPADLRVTARGSRAYLLTGGEVFCADVADLLGAA